jgi:hypothetical protein
MPLQGYEKIKQSNASISEMVELMGKKVGKFQACMMLQKRHM